MPTVPAWAMITPAEDRRRVDVELTEAGHDKWVAAMRLRGEAEKAMVEPLDLAEQDELSALLKRMLIRVETRPSQAPSGH